MVQIITMPDNNKPWWGKLFAFSECTTSGPAMDPHGHSMGTVWHPGTRAG